MMRHRNRNIFVEYNRKDKTVFLRQIIKKNKDIKEVSPKFVYHIFQLIVEIYNYSLIYKLSIN